MAGYVLWRKGGVSMVDAVRAAGGGNPTAEYALRELRRFLLHLDLDSWERHPARLRSEVSSTFRRTIGRITVHRGGWRVANTRTHG